MDIITLNSKNLATEHICCAITEKKGEPCMPAKKAWLQSRFADGQINARGKAFIEYMPAEAAWCPITAPGYMHINCFWVSGQLAGHGYANALLNACAKDAKAKNKLGLTVLSSKKKMPFLSDPGYLKHKGFIVADTTPPYYELLYLPFLKAVPVPHFNQSVKLPPMHTTGMALYYTDQCPHTSKCTALIKGTAEKMGIQLQLVKFEDAKTAQNAPAPFTTYSLFYNGKFITNEILSEKKFQNLLATLTF